MPQSNSIHLDDKYTVVAIAIARIPERIRGFGHVKLRHLEQARIEERKLLDQFHQSASIVRLAVPV
ncbi:MAG: indolepyruvate ferredoxin oxidoreductase [Halieaceae bacterium]|jgi:indolepyruvate ferredoxin oxidoreductase